MNEGLLLQYPMDSMLKDSFIPSFYQPPNQISPASRFYEKINTAKQTTNMLNTSGAAPAAFDVHPPPNSEELMSALRKLQEKIRRLELERLHAEDNLQSLSKEAAGYKKVLESENQEKNLTGHVSATPRNEEVISQLNEARGRCTLLEKQLVYMRQLVRNSEMEKNVVLEQQTSLRRENDLDKVDLESKVKRLEVLEKECIRLTATQGSAQTRIHQLQEKLTEEEHHRKLLQDKAAQLETGLEINRLLMPVAPSRSGVKRKTKTKCTSKKNAILKEPPRPQVYPKAGELPFVAGKSVGSSHSLSANVQTVLHMMKHHSPRVSQPYPEAAGRRAVRPASAPRPVSSSSTTSSRDSLSDLLLAMQEELAQMSLEHQELLKQIQDTHNNGIREDLERELDCLIKQMEAKGENILKLKKHQANVKKLKQRARKAKKSVTVTNTKLERASVNKEQVASPRGREVLKKGRPAEDGPSSLQLLKNVKKLQLTLKKEDIMWEK